MFVRPQSVGLLVTVFLTVHPAVHPGYFEVSKYAIKLMFYTLELADCCIRVFQSYKALFQCMHSPFSNSVSF